MKNNATDVIRRGFDSTLANWPLIVARVIETFVAGIAIVGTLIAVVIPIFVSAGVSDWKLPDTDKAAQAMLDILAQHAALFLYILVIGFVMLGVLIAIHSFVTAGCAAVLVDAERAVAGQERPPRDAYRAYTADRFFSAARAGWSRLFWAYNATWGLGGLIILVPATLVLIATIAASTADNVMASVAIGCGGIALLVLIAFPVGFLIMMWTQKVIILLVDPAMSVGDALREGRRAIRADFVAHFVVSLIMFAIMIGAGMVVSSLGAPFSMMTHHAGTMLLFAGPQLAISLLQNAVSNAIGCWFLASYAAMTVRR